MDMFDAAWQPVKEFYLERGFPLNIKELHRGYNDGTGRRIVNLRLDAEVSADIEDFSEHLNILWAVAKPDIEDLYENGDLTYTSSPLLKAMKGSKIRGQKLTLVSFTEVSLFREYKPRTNMYEYTMYILVYGEWEGDSNESETLQGSITR